MTKDALLSLVHSRKVLLAALGVIQTLVLAYLNVKPEVWAAIDALLLVLINAIATEDAATKSGGQVNAGGTVTVNNPPADPAPKA